MTILVPFNKLVPSKSNVRRVQTDLSPLVASLRADGILQNLVVVPRDDGRYEVVAGERRRRAAGVLVKEGAWRKDQPIPCEVRSAQEAVAISIAENVERVAMHPADALRAFAKLVAEDHDETAIAHRYGYAPGEVRKLLRLAALSPKALAALAADRIDVAYAQALTLTDDHEVQDAVLKRASTAHEARRLLTCHKVATTHRLFRFIADEYAAAGGSVTHDLFGSDGYAGDAEQVAKLVADKLEALAEAARGDGWGEVIASENEPPQVYGWHRLSPEGTREWTEDESEAVANAQARLAAREESLGDAEPTPEDRAYLAEQRAVIAAARAAARSYAPEQKAGGCLVITVDCDGGARHTAYARRQPRCVAANDQPPERPLYPASLVEGLSKVRTQALQLSLARNPALAMAVLLDALLPLAGGSGHGHAVGLRADAVRLDGADGLNATPLPAPSAEVADLLAELPPDAQARLDWLRALAPDTSMRLLAYATATLVDATRGKFADPRRLASAGRLAAAAGLDMREHWSGGAEFFARLTKRACLEALREGVGPQAADNCARLGKAELATACAERLAGSGWLPGPLRAPVAEAATTTDDRDGDDEQLAA